jgi:hypothetical protein
MRVVWLKEKDEERRMNAATSPSPLPSIQTDEFHFLSPPQSDHRQKLRQKSALTLEETDPHANMRPPTPKKREENPMVSYGKIRNRRVSAPHPSPGMGILYTSD